MPDPSSVGFPELCRLPTQAAEPVHRLPYISHVAGPAAERLPVDEVVLPGVDEIDAETGGDLGQLFLGGRKGTQCRVRHAVAVNVGAEAFQTVPCGA